jgi:hypothetical protein
MAMKQEIRDYFAKFGKEGGKARAKNMTAEQRQQAARKAVEARWAKQKELTKEITEGTKQLLRTSKANAARAARRRII